MSRKLALGLVLFGVMGASVRPPDAPIGEPILRDLREAQARRREMQEREVLLRELQRLEMAEREAAQFARYEAMARKRRATRHRESVLDAVAMLKLGFERAVATLERNIVLREEQRQELITLMTRETKPSRRPGPYDSQVLLLQLGRLPEEKLKRLFDEDQWQIVNQQLIGYRQMEPMLELAGLMPTNDDGADNPDEQLPPTKK